MIFTVDQYARFHPIFHLLLELKVIREYEVIINRDHTQLGHPATSVEVKL